MYILLSIIVYTLSSILASDIPHYSLENAVEYFENFIQEYGKQYANEDEKAARFVIFKKNLEQANQLNEENRKFRDAHEAYAVFGITEFSDLSPEEFSSRFTAYKPDNASTYGANCQVLYDNNIPAKAAPPSFDWRDHGAVSRVKHQGNCQGCYAFSTTGHLESQLAIKTKQLTELSEQQIIDCDRRSRGCNTGYMSNAFRSIMELGGLISEASYPYTGRNGICRFNRAYVQVRVKSCYTYSLRSQEKLKQLLHLVGPISIAVQGTYLAQYRGGVIRDVYCNQGRVNHAVLLVGYGADNIQGPYWIVKNSYGPRFGESGYFRMQRGEGHGSCGMMNQFMATATIQ